MFMSVRDKRKEDVVFGAGAGQVGLCTLRWYASTCSLTIVQAVMVTYNTVCCESMVSKQGSSVNFPLRCAQLRHARFGFRCAVCMD